MSNEMQALEEVKTPELKAVDGRAKRDSIRLWESYREQAMLWRALSLLQVPATALSIIVAMVFFFSADTIVQVPLKPAPGHYSAQKLPDSEFISVAVQVTNLLTTYSRVTARRQFFRARRYLWEPALTEFEKTQIERELPTIEDLGRSQIFRVNMRQLKIERHRDFVVVRLPGTRQKMIGNRPLESDQIAIYVKLTTIPRNIHNEYGIVVIDMQIKGEAPQEAAAAV